MKISVIHPSRGRPQKAKACYDFWMKRGQPAEWILSVDHDDKPERYADTFDDEIRAGRVILSIADNGCITKAVNAGAKMAWGDLLVVVSDDFLCPDNWANGLVKHLDGKRDFVARVYDGHQKWIVTLPIVDRAYYERLGYVYNPAYRHMFADTEMTARAELEGNLIDIPMTFEHEHPMFGKARADETNRRADSTFQAGLKIYSERLKNAFYIPEVVGQITDTEHLKWMAKHG